MQTKVQDVRQMEWVCADPVPVIEINPVTAVAELLGQPVKFARIESQMGRVAMVRFEPLIGSDPVLPVVAGATTGKAKQLFNSLYQQLLLHRSVIELEKWSRPQAQHQIQVWYTKFTDLADRYVAAVARHLSPSEVVWMRQQLAAVAAQPQEYV